MKSIKTIEVTVILMVLIVLTMVSACSHQPLSEAESRQKMVEDIQEHLSAISEEDRRTRSLEWLGIMEEGLAALNRTVEQYATDAQKLNADYDATREDFERLMDKFNTTRKALQQKILTAHFGIKALTTKKEWAAIAKMEEKAVRQILRQNLLQRYSKPSS